ncbi:MAG: helix-turn-helix transcriptional regulator [Actinomycetota bacterium]|nr:helix-turn-helix transcriptional regulator [Actinomycetota bacterium]
MPTAGEQESPLERAVARVGDRWALLVVNALLDGPRRFGELQDLVSGIAPNVLSQRLKSLEREGVLLARPYCARPPRFAYELTASGRELAGALRLLAQWGSAGDGAGLHHDACGTVMEARWWCPTCERAVDDHEREDGGDDDLRFV